MAHPRSLGRVLWTTQGSTLGLTLHASGAVPTPARLTEGWRPFRTRVQVAARAVGDRLPG
ncbi:hypothetical protein GCM10009616_33770 [Microlunatus lacustris]